MFRFCDNCGDGYHAKRKRPVGFCSGACRVAHHRGKVSNAGELRPLAPVSNDSATQSAAVKELLGVLGGKPKGRK
jgi:hypothetical protein